MPLARKGVTPVPRFRGRLENGAGPAGPGSVRDAGRLPDDPVQGPHGHRVVRGARAPIQVARERRAP